MIESSSISGGRKTVTHEFPNQDKRYVEDLGLMNEMIEIQATIPTDSYFFSRNALKAALESEGYGTLIHPFYGIRNVACLSYKIDESTADLGYVKIDMKFAEGQELNFPSGAGQASSSIFASVIGVLSLLATAFQAVYSYSKVNGRERSKLRTSINDIFTNINNATEKYIYRTAFQSAGTADYRAAYNTYSKKVDEYAANSALFVQDLGDLYEKADTITATGKDGFDVAKKLFSYDFSEPLTNPKTSQQQVLNDSKEAIKNYVKVSTFGLMCQNAAIYDYTSLESFNSIRSSLDLGYLEIIEALAKKQEYADLLNGVQDLYANTINYIVQSAADLPRLTTIQGNELPLSILTYQNYGSTDLTDTLNDINYPNQIDPTSILGPLSILSGQKSK